MRSYVVALAQGEPVFVAAEIDPEWARWHLVVGPGCAVMSEDELRPAHPVLLAHWNHGNRQPAGDLAGGTTTYPDAIAIGVDHADLYPRGALHEA